MNEEEKRLLEITRSKKISESDANYFEDHIHDYPSKWGNLYLWSIECRNYNLSDSILTCGFDLNEDEQVRNEVINSFEFFKRDFVKKIIKDGFVLDSEIQYQIRLKSNLKVFDTELLEQVRNENLVLKIEKIRNKYKSNT